MTNRRENTMKGNENIKALRDELRELEGEGKFREIPVGYVDSLTDNEVRERVAELREMEEEGA
jgi:hypothetical protein